MPTSASSIVSYAAEQLHHTPHTPISVVPNDLIQMTLVNIPDPTPSPDGIITSSHILPSTPHSSHFAAAAAAAAASHDVSIPPLQTLASHADLLQGGQHLGIPDSDEVTILG